MKKVLEGLGEFRSVVFPRYEFIFRDLATRQNPEAMLITCADSRIDPALMMQSDPGDVFVCRTAGNIVPPYEEGGGVVATVEYAVEVLRIRNIVVCGHSDCGAMKAALHPESAERLPAVLRWLRHVECARRVALEDSDASGVEREITITEENVLVQLEHLLTYPCIAAAEKRGGLNLYGWVYDIPTGRLRMFDPAQGEFIPFDDDLPALARRRVWKRTDRAA
jgi:carbonic anhydrase